MKRWATAGLLAPVILAVVVMLPRMASPQFGLLDDGLTLQTGRVVSGRWSSALHLIPETGRFFPAYWLVYSALVGIIGVRPLAFFAVNAVLLAGLLLILARLVTLSGGTRLQGAIALVLFASSGPVIETFYTLSKAESFQMTWIGISLLATAAASIDARRVRRVGLIALAGVALLLALSTKETTFVLIPIAFGWLAIEWWLSRERGACTRFAMTYVAITLVTGAAFAALRWYYAPLSLAKGTYTRAYAVSPETVGAALFRIAAWLLRDFAFLLPLLTAAVLSLFLRGPASCRPALYACIWMAGWLAVYLPWPATFEYYLLPFAFGVAVLAGNVVGDLWAFRESRHPLTRRSLAWATLTVSGLLWLVPTVNAAADARVQLTIDRVNAGLVEFLAGLPAGSRVAVNTRLNEYVVELPLHLTEIKQRPDLVVDQVAGPASSGSPPAAGFVATPQMANLPAPTVRIPLDEAGTNQNQVKLTTLLGGRGALVYRGERHATLVEIRLHTILCHVRASPLVAAGYCPNTRGLIVRRPFSYGWQVHRLGPLAVDRAEARHDE
jgi:hypothetical protein